MADSESLGHASRRRYMTSCRARTGARAWPGPRSISRSRPLARATASSTSAMGGPSAAQPLSLGGPERDAPWPASAPGLRPVILAVRDQISPQATASCSLRARARRIAVSDMPPAHMALTRALSGTVRSGASLAAPLGAPGPPEVLFAARGARSRTP